MTTYLLHNFKVHSTGVDGGHKYISAEFEHCGTPNKLVAFFSDKAEEDNIPLNGRIAVTGKPDPNQIEIVLSEATISQFPIADNWETFLANELFNVGATISIINSDNTYLNAWCNNLYVWCEIDQAKTLLKKFEFGRYMPFEKPEHKRKETSWTKGIFTNSDTFNIRFLQSSWDGEDGLDYQFKFTPDNKQKIKKALRVPIEIGWTEEDFRISEDAFYKARTTINIDGQTESWTYTLLDIGEQDIPMVTDKLDQWLRTKWGDSFVNNNKRHIDKTEIKPMMNGKKTADNI